MHCLCWYVGPQEAEVWGLIPPRCRQDPPWGWQCNILGRAWSTTWLQALAWALLPAMSLNVSLVKKIWNMQTQCQHLATSISQILKHIHVWGAVSLDQMEIGLRELQDWLHDSLFCWLCRVPSNNPFSVKQPRRITGKLRLETASGCLYYSKLLIKVGSAMRLE